MTFWFTGDEHYFHNNILKYSNRPFEDIIEMNEILISNHNSLVKENDTVIHAGDFSLINDKKFLYKNIINKLKGNHIFLKGSHDYWIPWKNAITRWEKNIKINGKNYYFVVDHYAGRVWAKSHYNSFQLYAHSHCRLKGIGKQMDIGVDCHDFYPISDEEVEEIMKNRPDNFNFIKNRS